jgi:hypothetical protein
VKVKHFLLYLILKYDPYINFLRHINRHLPIRTVAFLLSKLLTLILQNKTAVIYMKEKEALLYTITVKRVNIK